MEDGKIHFIFCFEEACRKVAAKSYTEAANYVFTNRDPTMGRLIAQYEFVDGYWERIRLR